MSGLWTPQADGTFLKATKVYAADANGTYQTAKAVWVTDASGTYQKVFSPGGTIDSLSAAKSTPSYQKALISWSMTGFATWELYLTGVSAPLSSGASSDGVTKTYTYTGTPGQKYSFRVRGINSDGSYVDSAAVTVTLDALTAPASFRRSSGTSTSSVWAWNGVTAATGYDLVDTLSAGQPVKWSGAGTGLTESGLVASTTYERAVRAKLGAATSALSNKVRYTTPAPPGPAAGTYTYNAASATAWAPGYNTWRSAAEGCIHGNGDNWGGANGDNVTLFTYGNRPWLALRGGRVTRFKIRIRRDSSAGYSSAQSCRWWAHNYIARPAGVPTIYGPLDAGSLAWGDDALIDLPVSWGQNLIDGGVIGGFAWGNVPGRYMRGPSLASVSSQGALLITIG